MLVSGLSPAAIIPDVRARIAKAIWLPARR